MEENIECGGFTFFNNFDSANLARVEKVETNKADNGKHENNKTHKNSSIELPSYEFNIWTKHDCHGTEFQNNNKTWFYFGVKAASQGVIVKLNLVNLNKQVKMFSQGMCPVYKVIPGHPQWERIKEKPTFIADDKNNEFLLSFNYRTSENPNAITYFAFTYPFSYTDLQNYLKKVDARMTKQSTNFADDIYYHRENAINSLEGRRLDILTISSYYNILSDREAKIKDLFPDENAERPFKFQDKKIIFISARVHPGETPSSFVLNGFLNLLLNRDDQIAIVLRRLYIFKLIPMLNPDGVAQGYYRMDTRGINLNRLYLNPSKLDHPTIFAAKTLLRYYHDSYNLPEEVNVPEISNKCNISNVTSFETTNIVTKSFDTTSSISTISNETNKLLQRVTLMSIDEKNKCIEQGSRVRSCLVQASEKSIFNNQDYLENQNQSKPVEALENISCRKLCSADSIRESSENSEDSGLFLYIDFHGHASKKGIFMYGNHFDDPEDASACMLLPKLMSINNPNFHFTSCNFAEKNMYLVDKRDGMSREGSGRVAVYKLTGLVYSYTLECNYNTGRLVNTVPARVKEGLHKIRGQLFVPPKYNPAIFEEVGAALGPSILDMTGSNPNSRLPNSQYRSLKGLKSYLKLISANHFQTSLNKPLHKNSSGEHFRYLQDYYCYSTTDESVDNRPSKFSAVSSLALCSATSRSRADLATNNSCDNSRAANGNNGTVKKQKNSKRPRQASNLSNAQKFTSSKETKVIASKLAQPKSMKPSAHKKINHHPRPNFPVANINSRIRTTEQTNARMNVSTKSGKKISSVFVKRSNVMIKRQASPKLKTASLAKIRHHHKLRADNGESSRKGNSKVVNNALHKRQKSKINLNSKSKKPSTSPSHKSPKKSST